jgi:predicted RecA/RadA family phage recombinase
MQNNVFYSNEPCEKLSLPVAADKVSGDFVLIGDQGLFGVCATDRSTTAAPAGGNPDGYASVWLAGVFDLPVSTTTAADIGDIVYAVPVTGVLTPVATNNIAVGWFVEAKGTAAATVRIKLGKV